MVYGVRGRGRGRGFFSNRREKWGERKIKENKTDHLQLQPPFKTHLAPHTSHLAQKKKNLLHKSPNPKPHIRKKPKKNPSTIPYKYKLTNYLPKSAFRAKLPCGSESLNLSRVGHFNLKGCGGGGYVNLGSSRGLLLSTK